MLNLRLPGPTSCPQEVLSAISHYMVNHRGPEFASLLKSCGERLKPFFKTKNEILILTCSGTGGLEAAVANAVSAGDRVLAVSIGVFGDRISKIAKIYGADVTDLKFPMGQAADVDTIKKALEADPSIKTVMVTHNETSTGVTNPLKEIAATVKSFDKLLIVDAVSSLSAVTCDVDGWDLDIVVTGSQKGWMLPPGFAFVSVSERGWQAIDKCTSPRFYFDLKRARDAQAKGETPWTPNISLMFALGTALDMMEKEGIDAINKRHAEMGAYIRSKVKALGLPLLADEKVASDTVTAVGPFENSFEPDAFRKILNKEYNVVLAGGQMELKGKIFRIGHMGWFTKEEIDECFDAMAKALKQIDYKA